MKVALRMARFLATVLFVVAFILGWLGHNKPHDVYSVAAANTLAVPLHVATWAYVGQFRENMTATVNEINRNVTFGEDAGAMGNPAGNVTTICANTEGRPCKSVLYLNANNAVIANGKCGTVAGASPNFPYGNGNWMSHAKESWYIHAAGTNGDSDSRLFGVQGPPCAEGHPFNNYIINQSDPSFIQWINDGLQNGTFNHGATRADQYYALMVDNTSHVQSSFYRYVGEKRNCGMETQDSEIKIIASDCSSSREYPNDDAYQRMHLIFLTALRHSPTGPYHGQSWNVFYNGLETTDMTLLREGASVLGGVCEYCVVFSGRPASAKRIAHLLDVASFINKTTTKSLVILSTGNNDIGSQQQLRDRRLHRAAVWLSFEGSRTISWGNLESGQPIQSPEWPEDYIYPTDPVQSMAAGEAGTHGAADLIVEGAYPGGVFRREFRRCYDGSSGSPKLVGTCAVVLNLTSSAVRVEPSWLSQRYAHQIGFCARFSSYTGDPGCSPTSSAGDVLAAHGTGPGMLDMVTLNVDDHTIAPPNDAIFLTSK